MESVNVRSLLGMVRELDTELDSYLAGAEASEAMPSILDTCQQMRSQGLNNSLRYWIECIEFHASQIAAPSKATKVNDHVDAELVSFQLQQDISYLRTYLTNMRSLVC